MGNSVDALSTEAVDAAALLARGRGGARGGRAHGRGHPGARGGVGSEASGVAAEAGRQHQRHGDGILSSSPRFDVYGCDFGWGKPLAVRSCNTNKFDGNVWLYPGREGGGSIEVEVALAPEHTAALEQDNELWDAVSPGARPSHA